jgi:hypothetical protein
LAGEPEAQPKPDTWKKILIFGGVALSGLAVGYFVDTHNQGLDIAIGAVVGAIVGAFVAPWVWNFNNQQSGDWTSGRGGY